MSLTVDEHLDACSVLRIQRRSFEKMLVLFFFVPLIDVAMSVTGEKEIEDRLGINLAAMRNVSVKEWVNKNFQQSGYQGPGGLCPKNVTGSEQGLLECCTTDFNCDKNKNLSCFNNFCFCKKGFFVYEKHKQTACEYRPEKKLNESCGQTDLCNVAFSTCQDGRCACRDGFSDINGICTPNEYNCPYKTPLMSQGRPRSCIINSTADCPTGYSCLDPPSNSTELTFLTSDDNLNLTAQSYCCPDVPDIPSPQDKRGNHRRIFENVCLHGKSHEGICSQKEGYYETRGAGIGYICCPKPCYTDGGIRGVKIIDGICDYESY